MLSILLQQRTKKYVIYSLLMVCGSLLQAIPFVTTLVNTTSVNIHVELHFSDNSMTSKNIAMAQSYQVVNFSNKIMTSIIFSSLDRDKNGNMYQQLQQQFTTPISDANYAIALQIVPAHMIAAAIGTDTFKLPETQKIMCSLVPEVAH